MATNLGARNSNRVCFVSSLQSSRTAGFTGTLYHITKHSLAPSYIDTGQRPTQARRHAHAREKTANWSQCGDYLSRLLVVGRDGRKQTVAPHGSGLKGWTSGDRLNRHHTAYRLTETSDSSIRQLPNCFIHLSCNNFAVGLAASSEHSFLSV